jgi:ribosome biogenesis protein Nip4
MFTEATREEITITRRFFDKWGAFDFIRNMYLIVEKEEVRKIKSCFLFYPDYLQNKENKENDRMRSSKRKIDYRTIKIVYVLDRLEKKLAFNKMPYTIGLLVGYINKRRQFMPSLQGADLIARFSNDFPFVIVNQIAEKVVLYGRSIFGQSILAASDKLDENELVIILNANKEPIGIGRTRFNRKNLLKEGKVTVTTLIDAGCYLRNETNNSKI